MRTMNETTKFSAPVATKQFYPWLVLFVAASLLIYKYILQVYPGVITSQLMQVFHVSGAGLGNLAATFFYSYLVAQLFVGVLLDKFGTRYLATGSLLISAFGAYLFSQTSDLLVAEFARLLMGFGAAFATVGYMKMAAMWFPPERFAFVGGLLATAAMAGALFGEAPLSWLVDHSGWRQALEWCGLLGIVFALLFFTVARDNTAAMAAHDQQPILPRVKRVFLNKQNWLVTIYSGLAFSPVAVFGGLWGNPFLQEAYHISHTGAASLISMVFIGLAIGGPALGYLADAFTGRKPMMFAGTLLAFVCILAVIYLPGQPYWLLSVLLFGFGFGVGSFMLGFAVGTANNERVLAATVVAMINTGDAIMGAFTEPLVGKLLDLGWHGKLVDGARYFLVQDYHFALALLPVYLLVATVLVKFIQVK